MWGRWIGCFVGRGGGWFRDCERSEQLVDLCNTLIGVRERSLRGVLTTEASFKAGVRFASFGHGIVAGVEVFALLEERKLVDGSARSDEGHTHLELVLQQVLRVGHLAVQSKDLLLLLRHLLHGASAGL